MSFIFRLLVSAFALWVASLIPALQITITAFPPGETLQFLLTLVIIAELFSIVNSILGTIIKIAAFPMYIFTLGLISLVINGFLLWFTAWLTAQWGWGLEVGDFWRVVIAALVIGIVNSLMGSITRARTKKN